MTSKANTLPDAPPREGAKRRARYDLAYERAKLTGTGPAEWFANTRLLEMEQTRTPQSAWGELADHNRVAPADLNPDGTPAQIADADWLSEYSVLTAQRRENPEWSWPLGILRHGGRDDDLPTVLVTRHAGDGVSALDHIRAELVGQGGDLFLTLSPVTPAQTIEQNHE